MAENQSSSQSGEGSESEEKTAVVSVPEHLAQQVIDFVSSLEQGDDVQGQAFTRRPLGGALAGKGWTGTQCQQTSFGYDMNCADTDEIVTKLQ